MSYSLLSDADDLKHVKSGHGGVVHSSGFTPQYSVQWLANLATESRRITPRTDVVQERNPRDTSALFCAILYAVSPVRCKLLL